MTAKKMADIFFGKFSKLISKDETEISEERSNDKIIHNKKPNKKLLFYSVVIVAAGILIFLIF